MSAKDIGSICYAVVSSNTRGLTQKGFGTPMVIGVHNKTQGEVSTYNSVSVLSDLVLAGFTSYDPIYRTVASIISAPTKPQQIKIGKLVTAFSQTFTLTIPDTVVIGKIYSFTLIAPTGVETAISFTAVDTLPASIATGLAALITAVTGITATPASNVVTCSADSDNQMWLCQDIDPLYIEYKDTTVDSNLVTELTANDIVDNDWYCLHLADPNSEARSLALSAYLETKEKIWGASTHDADVLDSTSEDDLMYDANAAGYNRTFIIYSADQSKNAAARWAGGLLSTNPGSNTWAYKNLSGIIVDDKLTTQHITSIEGKSGNYYVDIQGLARTFNGKMASGEWIDFIRGRDHFVQRCRERVWQFLANVTKVPFTDAGIQSVISLLKAQVEESTAYGYLDPEREAIYNYPKAADVSDANKANRILPDVSVEVYLAGAIHIINPLTVVISL
jgi:hypothetical protein